MAFLEAIAVFLFTTFVFVFVSILIIDFINFLKKYPPFVASKERDFEHLLRFFEHEKVYSFADLGAGNGKVLVSLAQKTEHKLSGYELNPFLSLWAKIKFKILGLKDRVEIHQKDLFKADLSQHDFYYIYGIASIIDKLEEKMLEEAEPGTYVASNRFKMKKLTHVVSSDNIHLYKI